MFHKLQLRLMLVNLSVIFILFILLVVGTYVFVDGKMAAGRLHMMQRMTAAVLDGDRVRPPGPPPGPPGAPGPMLFFAKVNARGIVDTSAYVPLSLSQLTEVVRQAEISQPGDSITLADDAKYVFRKTELPDSAETLYVFLDLRHDQDTLKLLLTALALIGILCMLLSLAGSYYLANKAMVPIRTAWQQQRDFLADASHELRTPLAVIQTNLDIVRDAPAETVASQMRWLNNIQQDVQQMTSLVGSLLFLSQADSQQQFLTRQMFALDQAVLATVEAFRPLADKKSIELITLTASGVMYYGDEGKLRQALGILLDNAIRHTLQNGTIQIVLDAEQQRVVLSVTDTGEGISPQEIQKIFLRFYQADSSRSKGGSGLGLAIAKWIVEAHGGAITVSSEPDKGARFSFLLPQGVHT